MPLAFTRPYPQPTQNLRTGSLPADMTLTRATAGWTFNSSGVLTSTAIDTPRYNYNPNGLALQGLRNEPAATNSIRNPNAGIAAGSPGTVPTNWSVTGSGNGLTRTVVGSGTEDGIPYVDLQWAGTASANSSLSITPESTTGVVAALGQSWVASSYLRLVAGSFSFMQVALDFNIAMNERTAAGGALGGAVGTVSFGTSPPTNAALRTQRFNSLPWTTIQATIGRITQRLAITFHNNDVIDFTLRVGMPQLVQAAAATSAIVTAGAAVARAADITTVTGLSGTHDILVSRVNGQTMHSAVDCSGGSFVVPTDPSPLIDITVL